MSYLDSTNERTILLICFYGRALPVRQSEGTDLSATQSADSINPDSQTKDNADLVTVGSAPVLRRLSRSVVNDELELMKQRIRKRGSDTSFHPVQKRAEPVSFNVVLKPKSASLISDSKVPEPKFQFAVNVDDSNLEDLSQLMQMIKIIQPSSRSNEANEGLSPWSEDDKHFAVPEDEKYPRKTKSFYNHKDKRSDEQSDKKITPSLENKNTDSDDNSGSSEQTDQLRKLRQAEDREDENLEEGNNAIRITNQESDGLLNKRDMFADVVENADNKDAETVNTEDDLQKDSGRKKRQDSSSGVVKGLEKSGDLKVSGNKSPLASTSDTEFDRRTTLQLKATTISSETPAEEKRSANEYSDTVVDDDSEIEAQLQARIDAVKEKVKREIEAMQKESSCCDDGSNNNNRKKRNADTFSTLLDSEDASLDPNTNPGNEQKPKVRKRRQVDYGEYDSFDPQQNHNLHLQKRQVSYEVDDPQENEDKIEADNDNGNNSNQETENVKDSYYPNFLFDPSVYNKRRKRCDALDPEVARLHGGGPTANHRIMARKRERQIDERYKRAGGRKMKFVKRRGKIKNSPDEERDNLNNDESKYRDADNFNSDFSSRVERDNSESEDRGSEQVEKISEDLFGALPQSYDGELARSKRI